jgi:hypothetical protein
MKPRDDSLSAMAAAPAAREIVLPPEYRVLPTSVPFYIPGFEKQRYPQSFAFAPEAVECDVWFERFAGRVLQAVGSTYLPVCRMSDGEFMLLFGYQPPSVRHALAASVEDSPFAGAAHDTAAVCRVSGPDSPGSLVGHDVPRGTQGVHSRTLVAVS